ncbi:MAG: ABC transporter permease [Muribaculaceae bacterium]|nr:ABC transporter permease [Muribaculaceae bacterium]
MKNFFKQYYNAFLHEFKLVKGDVGILIFLILLPLAYPIVYSLIYNPELVRKVQLVVVDNDRTPLSRELVRRMDATQGTWVIGYAANLQEARRAVNNHDAYGILEIPEGFARNAGEEHQAVAVLYCEMSLMLRYKALLVSATNVMEDLGGTITTERIDRIAPLAETISVGDLMPVENIQMGNIEGGFDSFIMPGILILILQQAMLLAIGMSGGAVREDPRKASFNPLGSKYPSVLATMFGQSTVFLILMLVPAIYIIHYVPLMFKFPMAGNELEEFLFILPMMFATIGLGFVLQGVVRERESIFVIWVVTSVIFLFLSGLTWPRYAFPTIWRLVSDCVPATWGVEGFIRMNTNGATLAQVHDDYINLWIMAGAYLVLGYLVQRFVQRPAVIRTARNTQSLLTAPVADQSATLRDEAAQDL